MLSTPRLDVQYGEDVHPADQRIRSTAEDLEECKRALNNCQEPKAVAHFAERAAMLIGHHRNRRPSWITAIITFVVLVAIVQIVGRQQPETLQQRFAAVTPEPGDGSFALPALPPNLAALAQTATSLVRGGQRTGPLEPLGRNDAIEVRIDQLVPADSGLQVIGSVTNISSTAVPISLDMFRFTDATGTVYSSSGSPSITVQPNGQAPLDLTLPIQNPTALHLTVSQPDHSQIDLILLQPAPSPSP